MTDFHFQTVKVKIKDKEIDYVTVSERLRYLREIHQGNYQITTEYQFFPERETWVFRAFLTIHYKDGERTYTGTAQEVIGDGYINKTSALENCETSAVGRACAMAGIGVLEGVASADEINKAIKREGKEITSWMSHKVKGLIIKQIQDGEIESAKKNYEYWNTPPRGTRKEYRNEIEDELSSEFNKLMNDDI